MNVTSAAYHPQAQHAAHGYSTPPPRGSFRPDLPPHHQGQQGFQSPSPYPSSKYGPPQQSLQPPPPFYQQFNSPHSQYNSPQPQGNHQLAPPISHAPQPVYTSAPHNQSVSSSSGPPSLSHYHPTAFPVTSSQSGQSMAASAGPMSNNLLQQRQVNANGAIAQQAPLQNAAQAQAPPPLSPQSAARERARVTLLLEINAHLLQEVISLQGQGKAGVPANQLQQSPTHDLATTSPTSATDPSNPLSNPSMDSSKPGGSKPPTQEYIECMRRLQANLAYLAAIADAKKKASGSLPSGPTIMTSPPHLASIREHYKKLNSLFPDTGQSAVNKVVALASGQSSRAPGISQIQG